MARFRRSLFAGIVLSSFSAFAISYSTSWAIRSTTSTTYSMVGALNKLPVAISGILFLPSEKNTSWGNVLSVFLAFVAGIVYSISQITLKKENEDRKNDGSNGNLLPISNSNNK